MKLLIFSIFALTLSAQAHDHREFGAHVHGVAQLSIAADTDEIDAELDIPGDDLLGFEHDPKTNAEKATYSKVMDLLKGNYQIFTFDPKAGCVVTSREVEKEKHKEEKHAHMDYEYEVKYKCKDFEAAKKFSVNLFKDFKTLKEIHVQMVSATKQSSYHLTPTNTQVQISE
jgi:hypothetical protein